jgi:hypothetical protein
MSYIVPEYAIWINLIIIMVITILLAVIVYITHAIYNKLVEFKEHLEVEGDIVRIVEQDSNIDYGEYEQNDMQYDESEEHTPPTSSTGEVEIDKSNDEKNFGNLSNDVEIAYKNLVDAIVKKYNLRASITPGELVEEMKNYNPDIVNDLKYITNIYELHVYGDRELPDDLKIKYFEKIKNLMLKIR